VKEPDKPALVQVSPGELQSEPPVVARLVVEIRSDGSRTIGARRHGGRRQRPAHHDRGARRFADQLAIALAAR